MAIMAFKQLITNIILMLITIQGFTVDAIPQHHASLVSLGLSTLASPTMVRNIFRSTQTPSKSTDLPPGTIGVSALFIIGTILVVESLG